MAKRSYGSGGLSVRSDANGRETWYGQWWVGERRVRRRLGPKREAGTRDGLTRAQAERELRRAIDAPAPAPAAERLTLGEASRRYLAHLRALGRKPSTLSDYESALRIHL